MTYVNWGSVHLGKIFFQRCWGFVKVYAKKLEKVLTPKCQVGPMWVAYPWVGLHTIPRLKQMTCGV